MNIDNVETEFEGYYWFGLAERGIFWVELQLYIHDMNIYT